MFTRAISTLVVGAAVALAEPLLIPETIITAGRIEEGQAEVPYTSQRVNSGDFIEGGLTVVEEEGVGEKGG